MAKITLEEFPSNSKEKQENQKIQPVVKNKVKTKKSIKKMIFTESLPSVASHVATEFILPATKRLAMDVVKMGTNAILGGFEKMLGIDRGRDYYDPLNNSRYSSNSRISYVDYSNLSTSTNLSSRFSTTPGYIPTDIIFRTREDAENVRVAMLQILETQRRVSVAQYKDLCREYPSHTDVKYGWTSLSTARVEECREGYYLSLPRPKPLI